MYGKREFGDYQTPLDFTRKICDYLLFEKHIEPKTVIEPTCGIGNFLQSSFAFSADTYYGIEINPEYCRICNERFAGKNVEIINESVFSFDFQPFVNPTTQTLIIGNPPWVTNSTLSLISASNIPAKKNFKNFTGFEAISGTSNFDICEYILLSLIYQFVGTNTVISMICKTSVARNVFRQLKKDEIAFRCFDLLEFDSNKIFGISASACVLVLGLSSDGVMTDVCRVFSSDDWTLPRDSLTCSNDRLVSTIHKHHYDFDGVCCFEWRQGIKHDCAKVLELSLREGKLYNGFGEQVNVEDSFIYPLAKSSSFKQPVICNFTKYILLPQSRIGQKTDYLMTEAPKVWCYLSKYAEQFSKRKSIIYRNAPSFSIFGVGSYSYARYKVGISGFYKTPRFSLLYSHDGKAVMTDDTSYYIGFDDYNMAYVASLFLNSEPVQDFLSEITFLDAKRPYTKRVLMRLGFHKILASIPFTALLETEKTLSLCPYITSSMYDAFRNLSAFSQNEQIELMCIS